MYFRGKLLLTGEYFVLDGARALAVPTRRGQRFEVTDYDGEGLMWIIDYPDGRQRGMIFGDWRKPTATEDDIRKRLRELFTAAEELRPGCMRRLEYRTVKCTLDFDPDWGLGSSSTLVAFLADYLKVDPYALLARTFGGSGYDLACAVANSPLLYRRRGDGVTPEVTSLDWRPPWVEQTFFVYRNRKQNSRAGIARYQEESKRVGGTQLTEINRLTQELVSAPHLRAAAQIVQLHEALVAGTLGLMPVKYELFGDFEGSIKSLGAWGGDFMWILSEWPAERILAYFNERGHETVIPYNEMVL